MVIQLTSLEFSKELLVLIHQCIKKRVINVINNIQLRLSIIRQQCKRLRTELRQLQQDHGADQYEKGLKAGQIIAMKSEYKNMLNLLKEAKYRKENNIMDRFTDGPDLRIPRTYIAAPDCTYDAEQVAYDFIYQFAEQHGYTPDFDHVCDTTELHQDIVRKAFETWEHEEEMEVKKQRIVLKEVG